MARQRLTGKKKQLADDWEEFLRTVRTQTEVDFTMDSREKARKLKELEADPVEWMRFMFYKFARYPFAGFQKKAIRRIVEHSGGNWYEVLSWARELAKSTIVMMTVLYLVLVKKDKRVVILASATNDAAIKLLNVYRGQFEANERLKYFYGDLRGAKWSEDYFVLSTRVSFMAMGWGQSPRGVKLDEVRPDLILLDDYDTDPENPYRQLIVWDPHELEIIGGYRYICGKGIGPEKLATSELFNYSETFVEKYLPRTIELGRSFIQPNYQGTKTTRKGLFALDNLWDGLGALIMKYSDCNYFFGKVTMYRKYDISARNILLNFMHKYFYDSENIVSPIKPVDIDEGNPAYNEIFDGMEYHDAYKKLSHEIKLRGEHIPPLFNSYMNLSPTMKVFGTAVNDTFGGVEETAILVTISDIFPDKLDRYTSPLRQWSQRLMYRWWQIADTIKMRRRSRKKQQAS